MNQPPVGTVTFLFTDIEGSTKLWQQHPDTMTAALNRHHALLNESITTYGGYVFQIIGDAFCAAFTTANDGLSAALDAQHALIAENWGEIGAVRVRMALHTGKADVQAGEYTSGEYVSGLTLSRAARLLSAGHGGQILLSLATAELVRDHLPQDIALRDLGARRLKDLIRPEQIFQVVAPGLPAEFAPLKTLDVHPHNLPVQLTSFIGREREMAEIKKLLIGTHLLTLTGVGGTGKTRLSLQVAADLIDDYPGGVYLVELAPLRDPVLVEQTVASVLGVREQPGCTLSDLLLEELREKQALLILDNCEHVIEACARLADLLLRGASGLKILATSRVHLNISGETTYPVLPLALPETGRLITPPALAQYEAVRLFIERATAVQPSFCVTNENAPAVAQICTHLDGIPLAIELAAARTRLLSPDQIAARLGDRFHLLTGGSRAALPRQQTLQAALDWSYDLLSAAEKSLFNRLAVFAGSFSLEGVEAICSDVEAVPVTQVLDLLGTLVDHSLVVVQEREAETRYTLLETVRQYALERLQASGEWPTLQDRHLKYYLQLAQEGEPHTWVGRPEWMRRFELEYDNFRVAMEHALESNVEAAVLMGKSLAMFQAMTNRRRESIDWSIRLPELTAGWPAGRIRALALWLAGGRRVDPREFSEGETLLLSGLEMARELGDKELENASLHDLANISGRQADWSEAQNYAEQHLRISRELDDKLGIVDALWQFGTVACNTGDMQAGRTYYEQSLEIARQENFPPRIAGTLNQLAQVASLQGNTAQAIVMCKEAAHIYNQNGYRRKYASSLSTLGSIYLQQGDNVQVKNLSEQSQAILRELKNIMFQVYNLANFAGAAGISGQEALCARLFGAVETATKEIGLIMDVFDHAVYDPIITAVRERLGEDRFQAEWEAGRNLTLEQALELAQE